jgi:hypothetical protein
LLFINKEVVGIKIILSFSIKIVKRTRNPIKTEIDNVYFNIGS